MNPLCKVKTVKKAIRPGCFLAANGDWNRKYEVVEKDGALYAVFLGRFYATGEVIAPTRVIPFKLKVGKTIPIAAINTYEHKAVGPRGYCEYWHVEPKEQESAS